MLARANLRALCGFTACFWVFACSERAPSARVQYAAQPEPFGVWYEGRAEDDPTAYAAGTTGSDDEPSSPTPGTAGERASGGRGMAQPSAGVIGGTAGAGGMRAPAGTSGASSGGRADGGAGASAPMDEPDVTVQLEVTTVMQHLGADNGKCEDTPDAPDSFGPCNIGAVWVSTPEGQMVDVLELWGKREVKHLVRYKRELGKLRPDVTTGATLKAHEAHSASWDHRDLTNTPVPPGKYKLVVEVADYDTADHPDAQNAQLELELDTRARPATQPEAQMYFKGITLRYE